MSRIEVGGGGPGGGGGSGTSSPLDRQHYAMSVGALAPGAAYDTLALGGSPTEFTNLLDLTTPTYASVPEAGIYAVTMSVSTAPGAAGQKAVTAGISLDDFNIASSVSADVPVSETDTSQATVSHTFYVPAGGIIYPHVTNNDLAQTVNVGCSIWIQKIT